MRKAWQILADSNAALEFAKNPVAEYGANYVADVLRTMYAAATFLVRVQDETQKVGILTGLFNDFEKKYEGPASVTVVELEDAIDDVRTFFNDTAKSVFTEEQGHLFGRHGLEFRDPALVLRQIFFPHFDRAGEELPRNESLERARSTRAFRDFICGMRFVGERRILDRGEEVAAEFTAWLERNLFYAGDGERREQLYFPYDRNRGFSLLDPIAEPTSEHPFAIPVLVSKRWIFDAAGIPVPVYFDIRVKEPGSFWLKLNVRKGKIKDHVACRLAFRSRSDYERVKPKLNAIMWCGERAHAQIVDGVRCDRNDNPASDSKRVRSTFWKGIITLDDVCGQVEMDVRSLASEWTGQCSLNAENRDVYKLHQLFGERDGEKSVFERCFPSDQYVEVTDGMIINLAVMRFRTAAARHFPRDFQRACDHIAFVEQILREHPKALFNEKKRPPKLVECF